MGANDASYSCVFQREDDQGRLGVSLSKQVAPVPLPPLRPVG